MPIKYSCFISYRHGQYDLTVRFVEELTKALKQYIEPLLDEEVYIDMDRLKGGEFFNEKLAEAICQSVCMIVVFTPKYFDTQKTYCAREYMAMKRLEEKRLKKLADKSSGFIIPVVFRGPNYMPDEIRNQRQFYDFSKYTLVRPEIGTNETYAEYIDRIANYIYELYKRLQESGEDPANECSDFTIPGDDEIVELLESIHRPKPVLPSRQES